MTVRRTTAFSAAGLVLTRDLRLAVRRPSQLIQPLAFFAVVALLFPLGYTPELGKLRAIAPGVLWVSALLASMLALESLFREDASDGTLEQFVVCGQPLVALMAAKTLAHWLLTGLPLTLMAPVLGIALGVPVEAMPGILFSLLLGTVTLSLIGAVGAGLTLGVRRGGVLLSLLTLPLAVPVLVFGARATELAISGESLMGPLYLLGALAVLGITLAPLAAAAAVRIGLE
ncbi:MAG: heme exporter protein CcmB [Gammaproteobacteria bacterium]|jgi:heme exporter protein B|nr:heme exporter protein CcmB [Gammaproteobacteria bacterium]